MTTSKGSEAWKAFEGNKADVDRLLHIHDDISGGGPGRKHGVEVLNKSAIVLITASWEAYVEDVAKEAFDLMLEGKTKPDSWPNKVRALASKTLRESKNELDVWELAGKGWKKVLKSHRQEAVQRWVGKLDTPKSAQVAELFETLLGLKNVCAHWSWQSMSPTQAAKKLDSYITVRGAIAHRTRHDEAIKKGWVRDYLAHVERLVALTDGAVCNHVVEVTGVFPW